MTTKHFIEEKVYSREFENSSGYRTTNKESFNILLSPDGSLKMSKKYFYRYDNDNYKDYDTIDKVINYLGKYEILSEETDMNVISIHLTERTGKIKRIDGYTGNETYKDYENKSMDKKFELIERKYRNTVCFSPGNVFKLFDDKSDDIFYYKNITFCRNEGLDFSRIRNY